MTAHPAYILAVLLAIEGAVLWFDAQPVGKKLFRILPSMFWIYLVPMLAHTAGVLPAESEMYGLVTRWALPAALLLLLLSTDVVGILRLGPTALGIMAVGMAGIVLGGPAVMLLYHRWLPEEAWKTIGPLCGSWIGGSANMVAVKEAVGTPDELFKLIIITDTLIPYAWMGLLVALSSHQRGFDRWNRSNTALLDELADRAKAKGPTTAVRFSIAGTAAIGLLAVGGAGAAVWGSNQLPEVKNIINPVAWSVILATLLGIGLSFTSVRKLHERGSSRAGLFLLYLVLASIGAKTSLSYLGSLPIFLVAGTTWILIHAAALLAAARILKVPMALLASASQACIGGPASAPVVAGIYHPHLAPVGLLLAVLGSITGTFLGLAVSRLCQWLW
ncbi:MAG: DUF819 family protein [Planctomycetales bacterium]|nr:DUF819 family protein [Planctomycetales bacterium]